jgi:hypothetical protein
MVWQGPLFVRLSVPIRNLPVYTEMHPIQGRTNDFYFFRTGFRSSETYTRRDTLETHEPRRPTL